MAIEYYDRPGRGNDLTLSKCPLCGHEFEEREKRSLHIYNEHEWADLGI